MNRTCGKMIDLGLPSGLLWAKCNVGAKSQTDFGEYFSWSEVKTKAIFDDRTFQTRWTDELINDEFGCCILPTNLDAATIQMGAGWRMPTKKDFEELRDNTIHSHTIIKGVAGDQFISKKDESKYIFIPRAGYYYGNSLLEKQCRSILWTSCCKQFYEMEGRSYISSPLCIDIIGGITFQEYHPKYGFSVRAVHD